jgi:hypothetical protein
MSIPGSGERKPVVMLTSSAVCVLCFTVLFLFLCSSVAVSLFGLASFFSNSFLLYFPLFPVSFVPSPLTFLCRSPLPPGYSLFFIVFSRSLLLCSVSFLTSPSVSCLFPYISFLFFPPLFSSLFSLLLLLL